MSQPLPPKNPKIKAIIFDFMGTCLDWHSSILSALSPTIPSTPTYPSASHFAISWRQAFFDSIAARFASGLPPEDIDITHLRTLNELLETEYSPFASQFTSEVKPKAVKAWHSQKAWDDVLPELQKLKNQGYELFVLANGTTRLQLDLVKSAGLGCVFDMLFSSELLGCYKPAKESYEKVLGLVKVGPEEAVMVAAHAYDLRAAKSVGMRTVYVFRWSDDQEEDQGVVRGECDGFLEEGMEGLGEVVGRL